MLSSHHLASDKSEASMPPVYSLVVVTSILTVKKIFELLIIFVLFYIFLFSEGEDFFWEYSVLGLFLFSGSFSNYFLLSTEGEELTFLEEK